MIIWEGVNFPASNEDIIHFEEINDNTFSINFYSIDKDNNKIRVDKATKIIKPDFHVNLLHLEDDDGNSHYVYIKGYSRLMDSQTNKFKEKIFHSRFCQKRFQKEILLTAYSLKDCMANEVQAIEMPDIKEKMMLQKHYKKSRCPYVIYGDLECLTTLSDEVIKCTYQNHIPSGFILNFNNG